MEILLVEDNPGDVRLTEEAFREGDVRTNIHVAIDGVEAMAHLRGLGEHADQPRPDLILLDLNLPRKDGREVLAEIKGDEDLKAIPVIVLSTAQADHDILKTYKLHANCYIVKPLDIEAFIEAVRLIGCFWLTLVKLSPRDR